MTKMQYAITVKSPEARRVQALAAKGLDMMRSERDMILAGKFDHLEPLQKRKATLMQDIEARFSGLEESARTPDRERDKAQLSSAISLLSRRAEENLRLLESAQSGVEAGREALALADPSRQAEIGLYSPAGAKISTRSEQGTHERKL